MNRDVARSLLAGPLGREMEKFPLRFCKPVMFGQPPSTERPLRVNNGTATLAEMAGMYFAITCSHVLDGYRRAKAADVHCFFAVGNCHLDPVEQLFEEDAAVDVAVIEITPRQAKEIVGGSNGIGEAFVPLYDKPVPASVDEFVAYGGFPGDLRQHVDFREISFGGYSSGACRVADRHADYFTCEFEREHWIENFNEPEPATLGGLSGGPAFRLCRSEAGVAFYEFAGIIYRMYEGTESLYVRQARSIPGFWS